MILLLCLIWGSTWLAIKIGLSDSPPFWGVSLRFFIAGFLLVGLAKLRGLSLSNYRGYHLAMLSCGVSMYFIPYALVYWGEQYISSGLASLLFALFPLYAAVMAHLFIGDDRLDLAKIGGIATGFLGLYFVFADNLAFYGEMGIYGMVAVGASPIFSAAATIIVKKRFTGFNPIPLTGIQMIIGAVIILPLAIIFENLSDFKMSLNSIGALLYLAIFGSAITFSVYYYLLKTVDVTRVALVAFITPLVAVGIGYFWAGERVGLQMLGGGTLVAIGVAIVNKTYLLFSRNQKKSVT